MPIVSFSDFQKLELRVGTIRTAEWVPNSEKLIKLEVDFAFEIRQIIAGIGKTHTPEALVDTQCIFVTNLEPRVLMGLESQGMLLAASDSEGNPVLLKPEKEIPAGAQIH